MKRVGGYWWPDYDRKSDGVLAALNRGLKAIDLVCDLCTDFSACVQAGAHVGVWAIALAKRFEKVYAFEPDRECYLAAKRNTDGVDRIELVNAGLLDFAGEYGLEIHEASSESRIVDGTGITVTTIDALQLESCGAIMLDVEGCEEQALKGAAETIKAFRPVVLTEVNWNRRRTVQLMREWGYRVKAEYKHDLIWAV